MDRMVEGKVVLITGAGSGIGQAGAAIFATQGAAHIYVVDTNAEGGAETVEHVEAAGGAATFVAVDVTDEQAVAGLIERIVAEQGRLDAAWNNAGINAQSAPFHELDLAGWQRMLLVNLTSVFLCMKYELVQMLAQGGGSIVNTSSGAGQVAAPGLPHYTAAKHGVLGITKVAASEYNRQGIRVNAICPGTVDTPMFRRSMTPEAITRLVSNTPVGRLAEASEIADIALWLCDDAPGFLTGQAIAVDGGVGA